MENMNTAAVVPWTFQGSNVRTVTLNGETFWVAKDVCECFGDTNHIRSISRVDDDDKLLLPVTDSMNRSQNATTVNESGLWTLLLNFQPEKAPKDGVNDVSPHTQKRIEKLKRFKKWVTSEVLPQIRKTGSYSIQSAITIPEDPRDQVIMLCDKLKEMTLECKQLITKIVEKDEIIKDQAPKVALAEACIVSTGLQTLTETAKVLKVHPNLFIQYLKQIGILYKEDKNNLPIDKYAKNGYFEVKEFVFSGKPGTIHKRLQTYVTGKGLELLRRVVDGLPCDSKIRSEFTRRNEVTA